MPDALRLLISVTALLLTIHSGPTEAQEFRTIDGIDNSLSNPTWGSSGSTLLRLAPVGYEDGVSTPGGANRPSPREISNQICAQPFLHMNHNAATDFVWQWGQFLDHDIDLTETHDPSSNPEEVFVIPVPMGDPNFDPMMSGTAIIPMVRSVFETGSSPRQQTNAITSFIDASNVYGSDPVRADALRTLDGTGKMRTSAGELLPFNTAGLPNAQPFGADPAEFFLAGDVRANEQIALTALHTLFVREHNRLANELAATSPGLSGDEIYLQARRIVGAQMQVITYSEFLPILIGPNALEPYAGYDPTVNPGIANEFSTCGYRVGHTMLSPMLLRYSGQGATIANGDLSLRDAFFDPSRIIDDGGIAPLLRGLSSRSAQEIDTMLIDDVRNFLFGPPGSGGFDLASLNIQRGRDHGLADYNSMRAAYGLTPISSFSELHPDSGTSAMFESVFGDVNEMDPWVAMLVEPHVPGAMAGELTIAILADQFQRLRDGDRFWYQNDLSGSLLAEVENTTLADLIRRNTDVVGISDSVFVVPDYIRGDCNRDGNVDLADAIEFISYIFLEEEFPGCEKACDTNDDGIGDLADVIYVIQFLYYGGPAIESPYPQCGQDEIDDLRGCYRETEAACP